METNPINAFKEWLDEELKLTRVRIPTACCLSTIGIDNFPNARFVSFKEIINECFIITGPLNSRKGIEISKNAKVALTFWWATTERQIRIQGVAQPISEKLADKYFFERNRESQIVSIVSNQGEELKNLRDLENAFDEMNSAFKENTWSRPQNWGGFEIEPLRIEFLEFRETRFHERILYTKTNGAWRCMQLQP